MVRSTTILLSTAKRILNIYNGTSVMQKSSQKYSNYHKSFDRAFSTRQDSDMIEVDNVSLPPLQSGDLVAAARSSPRRNRKKKRGPRKNPSKDAILDTHLKPVVIRGSNGLKVENGPRVHLPPININLQVRELLTNDQKVQKQSVETKLPTFPVATCLTKGPLPDLQNEENKLFLREFSVLPPIGKQRIQSARVTKEDQICRNDCIKDVEDDNQKNLGVTEALEKLAQQYESEVETFESIEQPEESSAKSATKSKKPELKKLHSTVYLGIKPTRDEQIDDEICIDDLEKKMKEEKIIMLPKPPTQPMNDTCRRRNNYRAHEDAEMAYERDMIEWTRQMGRRPAICEELDTVYRDLAVIVKHNLLVQHLEEICIF